MRILTVGHGARTAGELVETLHAGGARTVIDIRRFPGSRRHPQFNGPAVAETLAASGIGYRHEVDLGGRLRAEPGEERFPCIRIAAFRSYAARMATAAWQQALQRALDVPGPCLMCAETPWWRCHRRLVAELLAARGHEVVHLLAPGRAEPHRRWDLAEARDGHLYLCGERVA